MNDFQTDTNTDIDEFCPECGAEMENGVCPECDIGDEIEESPIETEEDENWVQ